MPKSINVPHQAFGYGRTPKREQRQTVQKHLRKSKFVYNGFTVEPFSNEFFCDRTLAKQLVYSIQPGDLIVAYSNQAIFVNANDAIQTVRLLQQKKIKLHVINSKINTNVTNDKELQKIARQEITPEKHFVDHNIYATTNNKKTQHCNTKADFNRTPVGWTKLQNDKFIPNARQRIQALTILDMHDNQAMNEIIIVQKNATEQFWDGPLNHFLVQRIINAARNRFPGPNGEIEAAIEGVI